MASAAAAAGIDQSTLARAGMRLYGDENFSGFFRRLAFSPDGALLVTPSGIFDAATMPASPTTGVAAATRRGSESADVRSSPAMRSDSPAAHPGASSSAAMAATTAAAATSSGVRSTVYIYGRGNLHRSNAPLAHLSGHKTASLVVRFSPILYELREGRFGSGDDGGGMAPHPTVPLEVGKQKTVALESAASRAGGVASSSRMGDGAAAADASSASAPPPHGVSMIGLPYRMVFAVATQDSVWIYDTQQGGPLCCFSNMHYASFTDLSWCVFTSRRCLLMLTVLPCTGRRTARRS
jgi:chromatin assembly factor 1 subunit B